MEHLRRLVGRIGRQLDDPVRLLPHRRHQGGSLRRIEQRVERIERPRFLRLVFGYRLVHDDVVRRQRPGVEPADLDSRDQIRSEGLHGRAYPFVVGLQAALDDVERVLLPFLEVEIVRGAEQAARDASVASEHSPGLVSRRNCGRGQCVNGGRARGRASRRGCVVADALCTPQRNKRRHRKHKPPSSIDDHLRPPDKSELATTLHPRACHPLPAAHNSESFAQAGTKEDALGRGTGAARRQCRARSGRLSPRMAVHGTGRVV